MAHPKRLVRHAASITCMAAWCGCAPGPILVSVPFTAADRSAIVVVEHGAEVSAFAISVEDRDAMPVLSRFDAFSGTPSIHVTAFLFDKTLTALGLRAGNIEPVPEDSPSTAIMGQREIVELSIDKIGATAWAKIDQPSGAASSLRIPAIKPCKQVAFDRFALDDHRYMAGLVALTSTSALVLAYSDDNNREGTFYEVSFTGARKLAITMPNFTPRHMMRAPDGTIYISGGSTMLFQPEIWAGDLQRGFTLLENRGPVTPFGWVWWMEPPKDATDPAKFYGLTEYGQFVRYEDDRWHTLASITPTIVGTEGMLVVNGRDDLYGIAPDGRAIYRYADGDLVEEDTPVTPDLRTGTDKLTGLARAPDYGVFIGSDSGFYMERTVDGWHQVNEQALIAEVSLRAFSQLASGGLLIGGGYGSVQQYYRTWGPCIDEGDVYFISNTASVNRMVRVGDRVVIAGVENQTQTERIIYTGVLREIP